MDDPNVGDIRTFAGSDIVQLKWIATLERPQILMIGTHVWTGEHWMPLSPPKEQNG